MLKRTPWGELQRLYYFTIHAMQFTYLFKLSVHACVCACVSHETFGILHPIGETFILSYLHHSPLTATQIAYLKLLPKMVHLTVF